jgi:hypothetical protein
MRGWDAVRGAMAIGRSAADADADASWKVGSAALEAERGAADPGSTERESARAVETVDEDLVLYRFAQAQHGEFVQRRMRSTMPATMTRPSRSSASADESLNTPSGAMSTLATPPSPKPASSAPSASVRKARKLDAKAE